MYDLMNKLKEKPINNKIALHKNPTPILSAEDLLSSEKRQQILTDMRTLLNLPDDEYDRIFTAVIKQFALFTQNLPETERSFYASLGGMLDHALERTSLSLFLARTYLLPEKSTLASVSEEEMLWVYTIFTASLCLDVGKIYTRHVVSLTDKDGSVIEAWDPFSGAIKINGSTSHYVFGFVDDPNDHLQWQVTPLLAREIIPHDGFSWLASNPEVLQAWLGLLSNDFSDMGWLKVIPLADAQILEAYFTDKKIFRHGLSPQAIALLEKIKKDRKDAQQRLKEFSEKVLGKDVDRTRDSKFLSEDSKYTKETMFGFAAGMSQHDKLKTAAKEILGDIKGITGQFLDWLHKTQIKEAAGLTQDKLNMPFVENGKAVLTNAVIEKFIADNKALGITADQVKASLIQSSIVVSVAHAQQSGVLSPALLVINPYVAFPAQLGVPPIAMNSNVYPLQAIPEVQPAPTQAPQAPQAQQQQTQTPTHSYKIGK